MSRDRTEVLIREAFTDAANESADPRAVLAELRRRSAQKPRNRTAMLLLTAVAVIAAVTAAVVVPKMLHTQGAMVGSPGALPPQDLLLVGLDELGLTDTVALAHVGPSGNWVVSLPRDSWVAVPGGGKDKLSGIYLTAMQRAKAGGASPADARQSGAKALSGAVRDLTGVAPEHYAFVRTTGIAKLAGVVGGVPVCLRSASEDPYSGAHFRAGRQTLDGEDALAFVRQRHGLPNGDLDRVVRQQVFLRSLSNQILATGVLRDEAKVRALLDIARSDVFTDPGWDLAAFAKGFAGLNADAPTRIGTAPNQGDAYLPNQGSVLRTDPGKVREYVAKIRAGDGAPGDGGGSGCVN